MLELFFPKRLGRLGYFVRVVPLNVFALIALMEENGGWPRGLGIVVYVLVVVYSLLFVFMPRARDCGMAPWTLIFVAVPVLSSLYGLILLFSYGGQDFKSVFKEARSAAILETPTTAAGGVCSHCGKKLLFSTDGVVDDSTGAIVCNECRAPQQA